MTANPEEMLKSDKRTGLIIVAHPDDEAIGATGLMLRLHRCQLIHVTDGAPRDQRFWYGEGLDSRAEYARIRRNELTRALALIGIEARCASGLGVVDQEVALVLGAIAQRVASSIMALQPDFVVTHAYEGGHPDHDALAFAVWAAGRLIAKQGGTPPPVFEMPLYHGGQGERVIGRFLPRPDAPEIELALTADEKRLKDAILDCYQSQREVLAPFRDHDVERFRPAPDYDFTQPPHEGTLLYEQQGFPMSGTQWRELVAKALRGLDMAGKQARERGAVRDGKPDAKPDARTAERGAGERAHDQEAAGQEAGHREATHAMESGAAREPGPDESRPDTEQPSDRPPGQPGDQPGEPRPPVGTPGTPPAPGVPPSGEPRPPKELPGGDEPPLELPGEQSPSQRAASADVAEDVHGTTAQGTRERPRGQSFEQGHADRNNGDSGNSDNHPNGARP